MNEQLTHLIETAIKVKEVFSHHEIRLEIAEDFAMVTITTTAVNDLGKLYQMTKGYETRLTPVDDRIEISLYID